MKKILTWGIIVIFIIINFFVIYNKFKSESILTKIFGYGLLLITSGSMEPEIEIGEVILIKEQPSYKVGDIITFTIDNDYLVTHRIIDIKENKYVLKGDNNNCEDDTLIESTKIEGKVIFHSKLLGYIYCYRYLIIFILIILFTIFCII